MPRRASSCYSENFDSRSEKRSVMGTAQTNDWGQSCVPEMEVPQTNRSPSHFSALNTQQARLQCDKRFIYSNRQLLEWIVTDGLQWKPLCEFLVMRVRTPSCSSVCGNISSANLVNLLLLSLRIFWSQEWCHEFHTDLIREARVLCRVHCSPWLHDVSLGLFLADNLGFLLPHC